MDTKEKAALEKKVTNAAMARYYEWVKEGGRSSSDRRTRKLKALADACEELAAARIDCD